MPVKQASWTCVRPSSVRTSASAIPGNWTSNQAGKHSHQEIVSRAASACQGTMHRFRFFVDHQEKEPCWSLWLTSALLPVPNGAECKAIALGKGRLCQTLALTNGFDINRIRDPDGMRLSPCGIALRIGKGILQPSQDSLTGCAHMCVVRHRCSRSP